MTFQEMYRCYDYKKPKNEKILKGYFLNIRKIDEGEQEERFISLLDLDTFDDSHEWLYEELKPYIEKLDNIYLEDINVGFWNTQIGFNQRYEIDGGFVLQPDPQYFKYLWKTIDVCLFDILKTPKKERIDLKNKHIEKLDNELFEILREKFPWQAQQLMEIPYDEEYEEFKKTLKM